jgi:hypothetical protein
MSEFLNMDQEVSTFGNLGLGIENLKREGGYLLMDIDGCLIEGGLETAGNKKTLEEWGKENNNELEVFRKNIVSLQEKGVMVGLSTGRGLDFSKRFFKYFFGDEEVVLDKSIVATILLSKTTSSSPKKYLKNLLEKSKPLPVDKPTITPFSCKETMFFLKTSNSLLFSFPHSSRVFLFPAVSNPPSIKQPSISINK